jgi:hypothetical protein
LPATRLGPYEIISAIGAGGMGKVYRARDTRLDRTVAIKVLPEHLYVATLALRLCKKCSPSSRGTCPKRSEGRMPLAE